MKIIKCNKKYLDKLAAIVEEYKQFCGASPALKETRDFFEKLIDNDESIIFIAIDESEDVLMGFVNLYPSYSTIALKRLWILNDLGVSKRFRGKGVAKALIDKVIVYAKETNAVRIELKTHKSNRNAQKLYKNIGFVVDTDHIYYKVPIKK
ncbi:MAG: GNAT family N-acetyltransferase [Deltaproteobacteria bacterium]|nr:GNAT family N-acetyltransferase [Deltaproteobacteria bacterium]